MPLSTSDPVPDIALPDQDGKPVKLSSFKGRPFIVYFYPRDDTPGCTAEACSFRDNFPKFQKLDVPVIGISTDPPASHQKFIKKFDLPFTLLCDEQAVVAKAFGVYAKKSMYGKEFWGIVRTTFLFDKNAKVAHVFSKVDCANHADEVLAELSKLS